MEVLEGSGGRHVGSGGVGRPFWRSGWGREALPEVRMGS